MRSRRNKSNSTLLKRKMNLPKSQELILWVEISQKKKRKINLKLSKQISLLNNNPRVSNLHNNSNLEDNNSRLLLNNSSNNSNNNNRVVSNSNHNNNNSNSNNNNNKENRQNSQKLEKA